MRFPLLDDMIKLPLRFLAALSVFICLEGRAAEDPLDRVVPISYEFSSIDQAMQLIRDRTECEVICPPEIVALLKKYQGGFIGKMTLTVDGKAGTGPARQFLLGICDELKLSWKLAADTRTITLGLPWRTDDPRSSAELLKDLGNRPLPEALNSDPQWLGTLDALLSKPENFDRGWAVRQRTLYEIGSFVMKPLFVGSVLSAEGEEFTLILISQPLVVTPGYGSLSYYWFTKAGELVGAGLMKAGHRTGFTSATAENSAIQLKAGYGIGLYTARFALGKNGLGVVDARYENGDAMDVVGSGLGKSMLIE